MKPAGGHGVCAGNGVGVSIHRYSVVKVRVGELLKSPPTSYPVRKVGLWTKFFYGIIKFCNFATIQSTLDCIVVRGMPALAAYSRTEIPSIIVASISLRSLGDSEDIALRNSLI